MLREFNVCHYERASFRAVGFLKEPRLDTTSTIECTNTISEENIKLRMGFHKSMDRMDNAFSTTRWKTELEMTKGRLKVKFKWTSFKGHGHLTGKKLETNRSLSARTFVESNDVGRTDYTLQDCRRFIRSVNFSRKRISSEERVGYKPCWECLLQLI